MPGMNLASPEESPRTTRTVTILAIALLLLLLAIGAFLRLKGLGIKSLWLDEFSTWHVSRMPFGESIRWGPELNNPPLYQLCLRAITADPRPSEFVLRLPAAVCGILTIAAGYWLACGAGGRRLALALTGLLACNALQIQYSQEARAYSMMVLGCTLSVAMWYRLVVTARLRYVCGYVLVTTIAFHAHFLTLLTVLAEVVWLLVVRKRKTRRQRKHLPIVALAASAMLCMPIVLHHLTHRASAFQGLTWIAQPTWHTALDVLQDLTAGRLWVFGLLVPAIAIWLGRQSGWLKSKKNATTDDPDDHQNMCVLTLCWLAAAWFGLLVISWIAHPAMLVRYAIPAAIPALLFPLLIAKRIHQYLPPAISVVVVIATAGDWIGQASEYDYGVRELVTFLQETVNPDQEGVVLTIDNRTYPGWDDMERLSFEYYPLEGIQVQELHLGPDGVTPDNKLLEQDPRALYLVVLVADPFAILEKAGRTTQPIQIDGVEHSQLLYSPYRLVRVAPIPAR